MSLRVALPQTAFYMTFEQSDAYPEVHMLVRHDKERQRRLPAWACYLRDVEDVTFSGNRFRTQQPDARQVDLQRAQPAGGDG